MNPSQPAPSPLQARLQVRRTGFALDADLQLPGRGVSVLFGASGSGKTTCLRLIAGLEHHPGCRITLNDTVWQDDARGVFVPVHQRRLGYVFQETNLFPHLSVARNLDYGRSRRKDGQVNREHLLDLLGIAHLLDRRPATLSGGERQRVAIARALLSAPGVLLMDEPLAALDDTRKQEILPFLDRLHDELEIPVVYVTHSTVEVARLADHLVILDQGRVTHSGPAARLLSQLDFPEAIQRQTGTVFETTVAHYDREYKLVTAIIGNAKLRFVQENAAPGQKIRIQIKERDVSLARAPAKDSSILNVFSARITDIAPSSEDAHVRVRLDLGSGHLVACVTRLSAVRLELRVGQPIFAQVKSVAMLG